MGPGISARISPPARIDRTVAHSGREPATVLSPRAYSRRRIAVAPLPYIRQHRLPLVHRAGPSGTTGQEGSHVQLLLAPSTPASRGRPYRFRTHRPFAARAGHGRPVAHRNDRAAPRPRAARHRVCWWSPARSRSTRSSTCSTSSPTSILDEFGSVVVASVRVPVPGVDDLDERDVDRWLECSSMLDDAGIELLEWFVIGRRIHCPRDLVGEPRRW